MARSCPKLQELWISSPVGIADVPDDIGSVRQEEFQEELGKQLSDFGVRALAQSFPHLRSFVMQDCHLITPAVLPCLHWMQLRQLSVIDCYQFRSKSNYAHTLQNLGHPTLQRLHLCSCDLSEDYAASSTGHALMCSDRSSLTELDLTYTEVSVGFYTLALRGCEHLKRLAVAYGAVEEALLAAAAHCSELEQLELTLVHIDEVPADHAWLALAKGCPRLRALSLENVEMGVVGEMLPSIAKLPELISVSIEGILTPDVIEAEAWLKLSACTRLRFLFLPSEDFAWLETFFDEAETSLLAALPGLTLASRSTAGIQVHGEREAMRFIPLVGLPGDLLGDVRALEQFMAA